MLEKANPALWQAAGLWNATTPTVSFPNSQSLVSAQAHWGLPYINGGFAGVMADPAYLFRVWSERGNGRSPKYPRLSLTEIMALPVASIAARDAWLFLWATGPHLPQAFSIIKAWEFRYSGIGFTWVKLRRKLPGANLIRADSIEFGPAPWHGLHDSEERRVLSAGETRGSAPSGERRSRDYRSARSRAQPETR